MPYTFENAVLVHTPHTSRGPRLVGYLLQYFEGRQYEAVTPIEEIYFCSSSERRKDYILVGGRI
jgi:hypothetical protein